MSGYRTSRPRAVGRRTWKLASAKPESQRQFTDRVLFVATPVWLREPLRIEDLPELVADIRRDESVGKRYNSTARTLMYAYEHRTIRVQEFPSLNRAKKSLQKAYGDLDITIMSNSGYLNREPFMVLP